MCTDRQLEASVAGLRDSLARFDVDDQDEDGRDLFDMITDDALEAYASTRVSYETSAITSVTVVFGTGGPHIEATCELRGDGSFRAEGWWGSDHVTHRGTSDSFEAWCTDYVDGLSVSGGLS